MGSLQVNSKKGLLYVDCKKPLHGNSEKSLHGDDEIPPLHGEDGIPPLHDNCNDSHSPAHQESFPPTERIE